MSTQSPNDVTIEVTKVGGSPRLSTIRFSRQELRLSFVNSRSFSGQLPHFSEFKCHPF